MRPNYAQLAQLAMVLPAPVSAMVLIPLRLTAMDMRASLILQAAWRHPSCSMTAVSLMACWPCPCSIIDKDSSASQHQN